MASADRLKWNKKWSDRGVGTAHGSSLVALVAGHVAGGGRRLLDIAGGGSSDAVQLASSGFDVTVVDVSDVGLALARGMAQAEGVAITTVEADLEIDPLPAGPWGVITMANFLQRDLVPVLIEALAPGGSLAFVVATVKNLERHPRPGPPFLVEPGELVQLADGLEIVHHSEAWRSNDRHEAHLVARLHL